MRKLILLAIHLTSCFCCIVTYGQADTRTLENRLQQASDPEKVQLLNQAAAQQLGTNPDQTIAYSEQAIMLARQFLDDEVKISRHKLSMEAEKQVPIVLELEEAIAYNNLGKAYYAKAQYAKSIKNFNQALNISEFKKFEAEKKTALENLVIVNETLKAETADGKVKWDKLIKNKLESLRIGKKIDEATQHLSL
jgi:tetratricopeptide (TPR) repeat protein